MKPTYIKSMRIDADTRYLHVSKTFIYRADGSVQWFKGVTFNRGHTKIKRAIWTAKQAAKRERRALKNTPPSDGNKSATVA